MQLCNWTTGASTGAPRCYTNYDTPLCKGAAPSTGWADLCYPNDVWSGTLNPSVSGYYRGLNMNNGVINSVNCNSKSSCPSTLAYSVRPCQVDLKPE